MIFPLGGAAPTPNPDLPNGVREINEEARSIVSLSPKASERFYVWLFNI